MNKPALIIAAVGVAVAAASAYALLPSSPKDAPSFADRAAGAVCTSPKFKVGDAVQTVVPVIAPAGNQYFYPGQIAHVLDADPKNGQCQYKVTHYQNGQKVLWDAWEFELRLQ